MTNNEKLIAFVIMIQNHFLRFKPKTKQVSEELLITVNASILVKVYSLELALEPNAWNRFY